MLLDVTLRTVDIADAKVLCVRMTLGGSDKGQPTSDWVKYEEWILLLQNLSLTDK